MEEMLAATVVLSETSPVETEERKSKTKKSPLSFYFKNGDKIRHKCCKNGGILEGTYDENENAIKTSRGDVFKSLSGLGAANYKKYRND